MATFLITLHGVVCTECGYIQYLPTDKDVFEHVGPMGTNYKCSRDGKKYKYPIIELEEVP